MPDELEDLPPTAWPDAAWHKPSPRLKSVRRLQLVIAFVPVLIVGLVAGTAGGAAGIIAGAAVAGALAVFAYTFLIRRLRGWGYAERDDDLIVRRGVMFRRMSIIPYGRMQFIDVTSGPIERSFRLATVRMHTAAAASDARIPGLEATEAARLRDSLTALGEARAAGL